MEHGTLSPRSSLAAILTDISQIWDFCNTVKEDMSGYEEDAAWPALLDDFVEWKKEGKEAEKAV